MRSVIPLLSLLLACTSTPVEYRDSWWLETHAPYDCSHSTRPEFSTVAKAKPSPALARLESDEIVALAAAEVREINAAGAPFKEGPAFLVRALETVPPDGDMTVTLCGDDLFVGYVAPPNGRHRGTRRVALLVYLPYEPLHVFITADEGVP